MGNLSGKTRDGAPQENLISAVETTSMRIQPSTLRPAVKRLGAKRRPVTPRSGRPGATTEQARLQAALEEMERKATFDARMPLPPLTVRPFVPR